MEFLFGFVLGIAFTIFLGVIVSILIMGNDAE